MASTWPVILAGLLLAPLVTWLPMLAARAPWLGLPAYPPAQGVDLYQMHLLWFIAIAAIGVIVGARDRWLGLAVVCAGLPILWHGGTMDPTHTVIFALGALMLAGLRRVPRFAMGRIVLILVGMGAFQACYALQQWLGYDLLWGPLMGGTLVAQPQMFGTLGSLNATAGYVAITAPLWPVGLLPLAVGVIYLGHSFGALLTLVAGLTVQYLRPRYWLAVIACLGVAVVGADLSGHKLTRDTNWTRVGIWQFAAERWVTSEPVLGYGLGGWAAKVPEQQKAANYTPAGELWREAHNEPIQWVVELGLVGLILLSLWIWEHRLMFADPLWRGPLAALAVSTLSWHTFHIVATAFLGIVIVGCATRDKEAPCAA